jgi:hypothetical protein
VIWARLRYTATLTGLPGGGDPAHAWFRNVVAEVGRTLAVDD